MGSDRAQGPGLYRLASQNRRDDMAKPDAVFIYIGTYPSEAAAQADYDIVKDLHAAGAVGTYDASVVTKDDAGKVHVNKDEMATRHGAWGGAAVGALVGILFPPAIIGSAVVGAAVGGVGGHLWRGMSRADIKEFGDIIDAGQAALVIVGESKLEQAVDKAGAGALAGIGWLLLKLLLLSCAIVLVETTNAKMRLFRVPELLAVAFTLGALALVSTFLF